ncbi:hypothetical protein GCM10011491_42760 [Brucella endophytica]|uniref:Pectate lyase superfamily protein domain-containing protein n=1 Tax=Brucella endophytica TaxID=1963359 RepID=A0A916WLT9_9HYPH|nr:hypothetical protein [Brucella endophytica]GGB10248.1 hypothetical protein GCM10011491_42760 [Brucella endophytica]
MGIIIDRTDGLASSAAMKGPVRCATTQNIVLCGLQVIDGLQLAENDRVLVKDQTDSRTNGLYVVSVGLWRRSADFNNNRDVREGTMIIVTDGVLNAGQWYVASDNPINIGTTLLAFKRVLTFGLAPGQINGGVVFETKAQMDASLNYADKQMAWVIRDPAVGNNGTYYKSGASGFGSWIRIGDLPYSFIPATNTGVGTDNAIQATTEIPIPLVDRAVLIALPIVATTTGDATVSFNGGAPLPIADSTGVVVPSGEMEAGQIVCGYKYQGQFRILAGRRGWSPLLRVVADGARRVLQLYDWTAGHGPKPNVYGYLGPNGIVSDITQATDIRGPEGPNGPGTGDMLKDVYDPRRIEGDAYPYRSKAEVEAATIPISVDFIQLVGYYAAGDGGGALYKRVTSEPSHAGKIQSADGSWWELADQDLRVEIFGAKGDGLTDDADAIETATNYAAARGATVLFDAKGYFLSRTIKPAPGPWATWRWRGVETGNHATMAHSLHPGTMIVTKGAYNALEVDFLQFSNENFSVEGISFLNATPDYTSSTAIIVTRGESNQRYISGFEFRKVSTSGYAASFRFVGKNVTDGVGQNHIGNVVFDQCNMTNGGIGISLSKCSLKSIRFL